MKKTIRMIWALLLTAVMAVMVALPAMAADFNFGSDVIYGSSENMKDRFDKIRQEQESWQDRFEDEFDRQDTMEVFIIVLIVVLVLLLLAEMVYIFIAAPKCGMSRFWALVPLFSNIFGLIVFIVVRSNSKQNACGKTVVCPTCNGVHPIGTRVCSICGTELI